MSGGNVSLPKLVAFMLMLTLWLVVGCAGPGQVEEKKGAPPIAGSFVGEVSNFEGDPATLPFVAIVAATPDGEENGNGEREARAYLCDGRTINEWFVGSASADDLELFSDEGAQFEGVLRPETTTGMITLPNGESFTFTANPAAGVAGLYDVTVSDEGQVRGTSESGGRLEGRIEDEPNEEGLYLLTTTITASDAHAQDHEGFFTSAEPGDYRFIVLSDGRMKGAKKRTSTDSTPGFLMPVED